MILHDVHEIIYDIGELESTSSQGEGSCSEPPLTKVPRGRAEDAETESRDERAAWNVVTRALKVLSGGHGQVFEMF